MVHQRIKLAPCSRLDYRRSAYTRAQNRTTAYQICEGHLPRVAGAEVQCGTRSVPATAFSGTTPTEAKLTGRHPNCRKVKRLSRTSAEVHYTLPVLIVILSHSTVPVLHRVGNCL